MLVYVVLHEVKNIFELALWAVTTLVLLHKESSKMLDNLQAHSLRTSWVEKVWFVNPLRMIVLSTKSISNCHHFLALFQSSICKVAQTTHIALYKIISGLIEAHRMIKCWSSITSWHILILIAFFIRGGMLIFCECEWRARCFLLYWHICKIFLKGKHVYS
jgi:hypothetical protein